MHQLLRESRRRAAGGDAGFTLVELLVAMVVVAIVMSALLTLYVATLGSTVASKQRQAASALATQNLERLRALPYDTIRAGLRTTDLTGDPNIASGRLRVNGLDEVIVTSTTQTQAPLFPHRRVVTQDGQTYTVSVYVTEGTTSLPSYQLTSVVQWAKAGSAQPQTLVQRSVSYASEGCLSLSNRPFSGPCQASFSAVAGITAGRITVTNASSSTDPIPGTDGSLLALDLPGLSASTAVEQTVTTSADSRTFGATRRTTTDEDSTGGVSAAAAADTDPSSAANTSSSATTPSQSASSLQLSGSAGVLSARPSTSDTGTASAEVSGSTLGCVWANAVPVASAQPCAVSAVTSAGTDARLTYDIATPLTILGGNQPAVLAQVGTSATPSRAATGRLTASTNSLCPSTSADGCATAGAQRTLGTITLGGLPARTRASDQLTSGFPDGGSLVTLTGLQETVVAEAGVGARSPSYTRAGSLSYWNGTAFSTVSLGSLTTGGTYDLPAVTGTYRNGLGDDITVVADATVRVGGVETSATGALPCDDTTAAGSCSSRATSGTALSVQVEYVVTETTLVGGTRELTRFVVIADLGTATATSYFRGAPSA